MVASAYCPFAKYASPLATVLRPDTRPNNWNNDWAHTGWEITDVRFSAPESHTLFARSLDGVAGWPRVLRTWNDSLPPLDPTLCLLEQGVPCNGPATRSGCVARCPLAGAPCIGCYGPADGVVDFGSRLMSAFASVVDASDPAEIDRILDGLPDPVGQFYRFSLAGSLLRGSRAVRTASPAATTTASSPPPALAVATHGTDR